MEAAGAALRNGDLEVEAARRTYRRRRDMLVEELEKGADIPLLTPEGGMFLMADVRAHNADANSFAWDLYRKTGVSVLDAGAFGAPSRGWGRISFGVDENRLLDAARRIVAYTR